MIRNYTGLTCVALAAFAFYLAACGSDVSATPPNSTPQGGAPAAGAASIGGGGAAPAGAAGAATNPTAGAPSSAGAGGAPAQGGAAGTGGSSAGAGGSAGAMGGAGGMSSTVDPGTDGDGSRTLPMPFKAAPEVSQVSGVPHGKVIKFTMAHGSSQRYPKAVDRTVNVYVPTQYVAGTPAPVIVVQDGDNFFGFVSLVSNTLDNLIAAKKLPPIIAVLANNGGGDAQGSERGLEYDTLSGVYAEWVDQELLPRTEQETKTQIPAQPVTFTKDPEGRAALGGSSGGVASFIMCWYHPDLFRRAIGFSPSFVAQEFPINPDHPLGAWNFHEDMDNDDGGIIAKTDPAKPIRFWHEAGTDDMNGGTEYPHYDFLFANQRVQLKMTAKGYHVHFDTGTGAGHVDGGVVKETLPEAMLWVWRGYQGAL